VAVLVQRRGLPPLSVTSAMRVPRLVNDGIRHVPDHYRFVSIREIRGSQRDTMVHQSTRICTNGDRGGLAIPVESCLWPKLDRPQTAIRALWPVARPRHRLADTGWPGLRPATADIYMVKMPRLSNGAPWHLSHLGNVRYDQQRIPISGRNRNPGPGPSSYRAGWCVGNHGDKASAGRDSIEYPVRPEGCRRVR
jgi:hypothetical protein